MNEKWMLMLCAGLFFVCETVEGRGAWNDSSYDHGDVVVTIFEITIVMVLVACCIGMFQQYDPFSYSGWNGYGPMPPPPAENQCMLSGGSSIRITVADLQEAVRREVSKRVKQEMAVINAGGG
jgi:hypothetical protein